MARREDEVMTGSQGKVFFDGEELFFLQKIDTKVNLKRENFNNVGKMGELSKIVGHSGKGSFTVKRTDPFVWKKYLQEIQKGLDPEFVLIGELTNKQTGKSGTTIIPGCRLDGDVDILTLEPQKILEDQIGFFFDPDEVEYE